MGETPTHSLARMLRVSLRETSTLVGTAPVTHAEDKAADQASLAAVLVAQRAVRNRRRRLRRKGLNEWSVLSL